jgi:hypothetical protein
LHPNSHNFEKRKKEWIQNRLARETDLNPNAYDLKGFKMLRLSQSILKPVDVEWPHRRISLEDAHAWVERGGDIQRVAMTLNRVARWPHEGVLGAQGERDSSHCQAGRSIEGSSEANITAIRCSAWNETV